MRQLRGSIVVHVGAGLSTSAGIPDFRGKHGVWTKLLQNSKKIENLPTSSTNKVDTDIKKEAIKPFDETKPTVSHLALKELCQFGYVKHIISQNVDGLFLKTNLNRNFISELHGNFYLDECTKCRYRFIRGTSSKTMRLQRSSIKCPRDEPKTCKGYLRDTILDWESPIPFNELRVAQRESKRNKLHICIGTSLQLRPSKDLVCDPTKNKSNKLVIINLQPTKFDQKASLVINYYADEVMKQLCQELGFEIPSYDYDQDPTKKPEMVGKLWKRGDNITQ